MFGCGVSSGSGGVMLGGDSDSPCGGGIGAISGRGGGGGGRCGGLDGGGGGLLTNNCVG